MPRSSKSAPPVIAPKLPAWWIPAVYLKPVLAIWAAGILVYYWKTTPFTWPMQAYLFDLLSYFQVGHRYFLIGLVAAAAAWWMVWVGYQAGSRVTDALMRDGRLHRQERFSLGVALGLGVMSLSVLGLGLSGFWYRSVFASVLAGATLFFLLWRRDSVKPSPDPQAERAVFVWVLSLAVFFLIFSVGHMTPEIFYDALFYHIAFPNQYRVLHHITDIPTSLFSNFVMLVQHLYGLALTLVDERAAKFLHGSLGACLAVTLVAMGRRFLSTEAGWLGAVLFFGIPLVGINLVTTGIDVSWSFFQTAAFLALMLACLQHQRAFLYIAGLLTGFAAVCKYPAFAYVPINVLFVVAYRRWQDREAWSSALRDGMILLAFALAAMSPFLLRNLIHHGNPIYPVLGLHWGTPTIDPHYWGIFRSEAGVPAWRQEFGSLDGFWRLLQLPWRLTFEGRDNGSFLGPLPLMFAAAALLHKSTSTAHRWWRYYVVALCAVWFLSTRVPRYGMPIIAMACPLLGFAILELSGRTWFRRVVVALVLAASWNNAGQLGMILSGQQGWLVAAGRVSKDDFLSRIHSSYPMPPYAGIRWMNDNLSNDSKILFVGESRHYYLNRPVVASSVHDPEPWMRWSHEAVDAQAFAEKLKQEGITHVYLNFAEAVRNDGYKALHWNKEQAARLQDFWNHYVELVWSVDSRDPQDPRIQMVYRLLPQHTARPAASVPPNPFTRWFTGS